MQNIVCIWYSDVRYWKQNTFIRASFRSDVSRFKFEGWIPFRNYTPLLLMFVAARHTVKRNFASQ